MRCPAWLNSSFAARLMVLLALLFQFGCVHTGQVLLEDQKQKTSIIPSKWRSKPVVLIDSLTEVSFETNKTCNKVKTKEVLWAYVNQRNPNNWEDVVFFDHDSYEEPLKIEATVYYPDGSKWTLAPDQIDRGKIDFTNAHWNFFNVPKYDKGILIQITIHRLYFHPEFLSTIKLRHDEPVMNRKILLTFPETCQLNFGLENPEDADVEQRTITQNGHRIVSITSKNLPGSLYKWKTEFPEKWYAALHVSFPPKGKRSYSWEEMGDHYLELSKDAFEVSSTIKAFGDTIQNQKPKKILEEAFQNLVSKVRYHGDWEGRHAFFPRKAETILANGYGDCKEISTLLHTLLKTKDMESRLSLISTWNNRQPLSKYPSLDNFNHMVLACPTKSGQLHFMDGTYSWANANNSYFPLVGRTALILEPGESRLVRVAKGDGYNSRVVTRSKIIQDTRTGRWQIEGAIHLQGFPALRLFSYINTSETTDKTMLIRRFVEKRFGILPLHIALETATSDTATITFHAAFQKNYLDIGKGGFKLSLPELFDTAADKQLMEKHGPVFLEQFEQHDHWELPRIPINKQLYHYKLPFADQKWQTNGKFVSRTYRQTSRHFEADDDELEVWTEHCTKAGDNLVWD